MIKWPFSNANSKFAKEFAEYIGTKHVINTSFGRTAIYLGLRAINVLNKEVIIPTFTCTVVSQAVLMAGATPIFVDIDYDTFDFDINDLKQKITENTKAIILTHYFGNVVRNLEEIIEITKQYNLMLVEDCAHSLGAEYKGKKAGTFGDFSIFSLTKNMINFGGGVLATDNDMIFNTALRIAQGEKKSLKKRILDFPMILAYGFEQAIDKLIFDRVNRNPFKWWLIYLPDFCLVRLRRYIINIVKLPLLIRKLKIKKPPIVNSLRDKRQGIQRYGQGVYMEPIIASLARTQLKKIDSLIAQRKKIYSLYDRFMIFPVKKYSSVQCKDVYTNLILRFIDRNIYSVIKECKNRGLLLRATWPTHQKIWENQSSKTLSKIEKEIVFWTVNPMLNEKEQVKFYEILSEYQN